MKTTIITTFILLTGVVFSQYQVKYTYDDAGNRVKRLHNSTNIIIQDNDDNATVDENMAVSGVDLEAHPNPTSGNTVVAVIIDPETISEEHRVAIESGVNMQVADVTGKVLKTEKGTSMEQTIDMQGLAKGVYFVKVFTESGELVGERKILRE